MTNTEQHWDKSKYVFDSGYQIAYDSAGFWRIIFKC